MTGREFRVWMKKHDMTHSQVSSVFDVSIRTISRYLRNGTPRIMDLACKGYDSDHPVSP